MATFSKKGKGTRPHLRQSSQQQLVMVGVITNEQQNLYVLVVTQPSLQAKLKSNENGNAPKVTLDTISCFVDILLYFFGSANYFLFHQCSISFQKLFRKMKTLSISSSGVLLTKVLKSTYALKNLLVKCRKTVVNEFFFKNI